MAPRALLDTLKEEFKQFDTGRKGFVTLDQVPTLARSVGLNPTVWEEKAIGEEYKDISGLPFVDYVFLFLKHAVELGNLQTTLDTFAMAFQYLDQNGSGEVDRDEFRGRMAECGNPIDEQELDDIFDLIDTNKDDTISYHELYSALKEDLLATLSGALQLGDEDRSRVRGYLSSLQDDNVDRVSALPYSIRHLVFKAYIITNSRRSQGTNSCSLTLRRRPHRVQPYSPPD